LWSRDIGLLFETIWTVFLVLATFKGINRTFHGMYKSLQQFTALKASIN